MMTTKPEADRGASPRKFGVMGAAGRAGVAGGRHRDFMVKSEEVLRQVIHRALDALRL
ncbi:MAG: hypothetical protein ACREXY_02995 [Gammaproteobacteria bacterium]